MRSLFWVGLVVLILGIASFFITIPQTEHHGIRAGEVSVGVDVQHDRKLHPAVGGALIAGGAVMMIAASRRRSIA